MGVCFKPIVNLEKSWNDQLLIIEQEKKIIQKLFLDSYELHRCDIFLNQRVHGNASSALSEKSETFVIQYIAGEVTPLLTVSRWWASAWDSRLVASCEQASCTIPSRESYSPPRYGSLQNYWLFAVERGSRLVVSQCMGKRRAKKKIQFQHWFSRCAFFSFNLVKWRCASEISCVLAVGFQFQVV